MQFNLSPGYILTVRISRKPIVTDGKQLDGQIDPERRIVWISCDVPLKDRRRVLFHELRHGWVYARGGKPEGDEADALDVAAFMDAVDEQFDAQGGTPALMAMQPLDLSQAPNPPGSVILIDRYDCPCGAQTMVGSVRSTPAEFDSRYGEYVVSRWFECEACGALVHWQEASLPDGTPKSRYIANSIGTLRGAERLAWLRERELVPA